MTPDQYHLFAQIEQQHWWFIARRAILRDIVERVALPNSGSRILDVGCGTGGNIAVFADAYECFGMDMSEDAVRLSSERFPTISFHQGARISDIPDGVLESADVVLLNDVIEHISDDFQFLSELLAPMKAGAHLLITVPADMTLWSGHDELQGHYRRYDRERLTKVWNGLPVEERLVSYFNSRLYPVVKGIRKLNRVRGRTWGSANMDFTQPSAPVNSLLTAIFRGEGHKLAGVLESGRSGGYKKGVSLIALLRREDGPLVVRSKPVHIPSDPFDPEEQTT